MKRRFLPSIALLLAMAALGLWFARRQPSTGDPALTLAVTSQAAAPEARASSVEAPQAEVLIERSVQALPATATVSRSGLRVVALWSDAAPAEGVRVSVRRDWIEAPGDKPLHASLDAQGSASFPGLSPGTYKVRLDRCDGAIVRLEAGREGYVALSIPAGVQVQGIVVDGAGIAIANAEVWLAPNLETYLGELVVHTDQAGRFQLRDVEPGRALLARARDRQPSTPVMLEGEAGERVGCTLVLDGQAGNLVVRVRDDRGLLHAGAEVLLGDERLRWSSAAQLKSRNTVMPQLARTDAQGACEFLGLPAGEHALHVRAFGQAPWAGLVTIEVGRTAELEIALANCGSIIGAVSDDDGKPLSGVIVGAGGPGGFQVVEAVSAADGSFRLDGLGAGVIEAWARGGNAGSTKQQLEVVAGQETRWDIQLANERRLSGTVIDPAGNPLQGWIVSACKPGSVHEYGAIDRTDAQGRFRLDSISEETSWLSVFAVENQYNKPSLVLREFALPTEDLVLRIPAKAMPTASIQGTLYGPQLGPVPNSSVGVRSEFAVAGSGFPVDPESGRFLAGPLLPGHYSLMFRSEGLGLRIMEVDLAAGQAVDLGVVSLSPQAALSIELRLADGSAPRVPINAILVRDGGRDSRDLLCEEGRGGPILISDGVYRLHMSRDWHCEPQLVRVETGAPTHVIATVARGAGRFFRVEAARGVLTSSVLRWELRDAKGRDLWSGTCRLELDGAIGYALPGMPLGEYTLDVLDEQGVRGSLGFSNSVVGWDETALVVVVR